MPRQPFGAAQKTFSEILNQNLAGKIHPVKPLGPMPSVRALPKNFTIPATTQATAQRDPAQYILTHSTLGRAAIGSSGQSLASAQEDEEPGIATKIFDTLGIPLNLALNTVNEAVDVIQGEQSIGGMVENQVDELAASGARVLDNAWWKPDVPFTDIDSKFYNAVDKAADKSSRVYGKDLVENVFQGTKFAKNNIGTSIAGLAIDLGADPLNYIPIAGWGKAAVTAAKEGTEIAKAASTSIRGARNFVKTAKPAVSKGSVAEDVLGARHLPGIKGFGRFGQHVEPLVPRKQRLPGYGHTLHNPDDMDIFKTTQRMMPGGPKQSFHGTSERVEAFKNPFDMGPEAASGNLFGRGLYTTKDFNLANSYRAKGLGKNPATYTFKWKGPEAPNLIDMEAPADDIMKDLSREIGEDLQRRFPDQDEYSQSDFSALMDVDPDATNEMIYKRIFINATHAVDNSDETAEIIDNVTRRLQEAGYDGIKHTGGSVTGGKKHEVNIFFDPEKLESKEFVMNAKGDLGPNDPLPTHSAANLMEQQQVLANPFNPETSKIIERMKAKQPGYEPVGRLSRSEAARLGHNADRMQDALLAKKSLVLGKGAHSGQLSMTGIKKVIDAIRTGDLPRSAPIIPPLEDLDQIRHVKIIADDFIDDIVRKAKGKLYNTPDQQVKLFGRIYNTIGKSKAVKAGSVEHLNTALRALRSAEDHLIKVGKGPQYWNGMQVRLSEVMAEAGDLRTEHILRNFSTKKMTNMDSPIVVESINRALARRSMTTGTALGQISKNVLASKHAMEAAYEFNPHKGSMINQAVKDIETKLKNSTMSPSERAAVMDAVRQSVNVDMLPPDFVLKDVGPLLTEAVASGRVNATVVHKELTAIANTLGAKTMKELGDPITANGVVPSFMMRFTTWYGRKDIFPFQQDVQAWGERNARMRGELMRNLQKKYTDDEAQHAWSVATGRKPAGDTRIAGLANRMQMHMEYVFGTSGLKGDLAKATGDLSVADKAQLAMSDINKELKRRHLDFEFTNRKVTDHLGNKIDFSKGDSWRHSWKLHTPKDPAAFVYEMDLAMENVAKRYIFLDELGERFGSTKRGAIDFAGQKAEHEIPGVGRLAGKYFSEDIRNQIIKTVSMFNDPAWRTPNGLKNYSKMLRIWKISVTLFNPSHHIRNLVGDSWLMWMSGINDPRVYMKSMKTLAPQASKYRNLIKKVTPENYEESINSLGELVTHNAAEVSEARHGDIVTKIRRGKKTHRISGEQYYIQAHKHGLLLDANTIEDVYGETPMGFLTGKSPALGAPYRVATQVSEFREHYVRMAHFIGETEKGLKRGLSREQAFTTAAHQVRKWHPDGRDLTKFEQNTRLAIPFYSWMRKSTPLIIQGLVTRPAKIMAYPKIMTALAQMTGMPNASIEDPFPDDQLFPDWIRAGGIGPIGKAGASGVSGALGGLPTKQLEDFTNKESGYSVINPGNPMTDFFSQFAGTGQYNQPAKGLFENLSPAIQYPAELMFGQEVSGKPLGQEPGNYAAERIPLPLAGPAARIFNIGEDTEGTSEEGSHFDQEAFLNWIAGLGLRGTGPYQNSSEFEARDRATRFKNRGLRTRYGTPSGGG